MRRPSGTRLSLAQLLVLVAAIAIGFAAAAAQAAKGGHQWVPGLSVVFDLIAGGYLFVPIVCVGLIIMEKMSGKTWRRLASQPGSVACFAIVVTTAFLFAHLIVLRLIVAARMMRPPSIDFVSMRNHVWVYLPYAAPYSVASVWVVLILSGRWRLTRNWVDLCGVLCGLFFLTWEWLFSLFG
jgi:hypothetical protein